MLLNNSRVVDLHIIHIMFTIDGKWGEVITYCDIFLLTFENA